VTIRGRSAQYLILAVLLSSSLGAHVVAPREPSYQNTTTSQVNRIRIDSGSGNFLTKGGPGREEKTITVFYHNPKNFTRRSPVLIVVPGAGRNASEYRDAWVSASEKYGVLILSPEYVEKDYPEFWSYNLGGMLTNGLMQWDALYAGHRSPIFNEYAKLIEDYYRDTYGENSKQHLSFGLGTHFCMGSRLAEMQLRVLWEEILRRFRLVEVVSPPVRVKSPFVKGFAKLPVRVHPW